MKAFSLAPKIGAPPKGQVNSAQKNNRLDRRSANWEDTQWLQTV
jgi:hypothetical protein